MADTAVQTRRRKQSRVSLAANDYVATPDQAALCATIRGLWQKEYRLGGYAPVNELCLELDALDLGDLLALKNRIRARLSARLEADTSSEGGTRRAIYATSTPA